jgi:hypothetical protein
MNKFFLTLFIGVLFSCSSNDSTAPELTKLEQNKINRIGVWLLTSEYEEGETPEELGECELQIEFKENNIQIITEFNEVDCSVSDEYSADYSITETHLDFDLDPSEIIELNETTLKVIWVEDVIRYIQTYTKQ